MTDNEAYLRCACICKCQKEQAPLSWTCLDCRDKRCPLYPEYATRRLRVGRHQ